MITRFFILLSCVLLAAAVIWQETWRGTLEKRSQTELQAQLRSVIDGAQSFEKIELPEDPRIVRQIVPVQKRAYLARDSKDNAIGYLVLFQTAGYQNELSGVVAVDPSGRRILRLRLNDSRESPGQNFSENLSFMSQFSGADCRSPVRLALAQEKGIHAVSGASVSSQIVVRCINDCIQSLRIHLQEKKK